MKWTAVLWQRVWPEVRQTWPFFLFLAGPVFAWLFGGVAGYLLQRGPADQVRYFGTSLQLFGLVLVAIGLRDVRREFQQPTVFAAARGRVRAILQSLQPRRYRLNAEAGVIAIEGGDAVLAHGRVRGNIEQRLDGLEREIDDLRKRAQEHQRQFETKITDVRAELSKEAQARVDAHAEMTRKLDNLAVGGLHLEVIGLWWLLLATVATSVPDEVVSLWRALRP